MGSHSHHKEKEQNRTKHMFLDVSGQLALTEMAHRPPKETDPSHVPVKRLKERQAKFTVAQASGFLVGHWPRSKAMDGPKAIRK